MTHRRAAIPALIGGAVLTALLWWAGASSEALHLQGATDALGGRVVAELQQWLAPWSYDPPTSVQFGYGVLGEVGDPAGGDATRYLSLYETALQIRFAAVFVFFVSGAMLLVRRLPPVGGRLPAALLALWGWGVVAGTLAVTVSAPWLIASRGRGSYRLLPQLAGVISSGRQMLVVTALFASLATVFAARVIARGEDPLPRQAVAPRAARLAATVGTALIALSLVVLSYESVAAGLQTSFSGSGMLSEPGDLLRQWLLLGAWSAPAGVSFGDWLLYRAADVLVLALVWTALRRLPAMLTRVTVPAMATATVCVTVLGLLASQLLRVALDGSTLKWDLMYLSAGIGDGVPAALVWGVAAGAAATVTLRAAGGRGPTADTPAAEPEPARP
ncbi:hypothetical protein [Streptomyces sp. NPDC020597]|uniref:hypothetical protein n=1 Tax=unclassified Streptomyces TaxID=2593676 RepID=UPI0037AEE7BA